MILHCPHCAKPLALADERCASCGQSVPLTLRQEAFLGRAKRFAEEERWAEAVRALEPALALALSAEDLKLLWRQKGLWLQRSGDPRVLDGAEAALAESLRLNDADANSHHLWQDLLEKRGSSEKARAWYEQRLGLNPEDAVASAQLKILRLAADFKTAPLPKPTIPEIEHNGLFYRLLRPSPLKTVSAAFGLLSSAFALVYFNVGEGAVAVSELGQVDGVSQAMESMADPWTHGITMALCGAYLIWAWKRRRG